MRRRRAPAPEPDEAEHAAHRELPLEPQPDVEQDPQRRRAHGIERGLDQLARHFRPDRFHRGKADLRVHGLQRRLDLVQLFGGDRTGLARGAGLASAKQSLQQFLAAFSL